ncbi:hypothetical protein [Anaerolactibacter massiliensis]|jgi:hypothetical protein|uniref:hypothetical protein n=1 Tax=Anaerolactibacter massiliensis TaxID=2044573 RepID=UPI000CFA3F81|nr:hypothetical protein [Anaerolactibacter massiliensis]
MIVSVSEKLKIVRNVLVNVGGDIVFHYRRPAGTKRFVVWQEDAQETALHVNNASKEIVLTGTIDFFTPNEFDTLIDDITAAFSQSQRVKAQINSVQYEDQTGLIHYEWRFWVI